MATLSTSAWVLHELGLAAGFGGPLFGRLALHRAVKDIHSEDERGKVLAEAWQRYNVVNAISLGTAALTWFLGRALISGRSIDEETRNLVRLKDVLLGATVATSVVNMVSGREMSEQAPGLAVPVRSGDAPSPRTPGKAARLQRVLNVMGPLNIVLTAGVIGVTTILAMKSGRSAKWSLVSRLLP
ncbi:hypothetical protein SOCEGT47_066610 [Sorangium cellulosum]|uniref:DUF4149 domain-containing protein n=1 Tax=Sorangium cellulosum TaxID=56 RepID=A0A4V0NEG6_SORCE|nr:hypothetical protein [Sorangium cellulosum]AUX26102.1 hypothetical protein SOCEGT47_066610 [Sorangium cellulosum]